MKYLKDIVLSFAYVFTVLIIVLYIFVALSIFDDMSFKESLPTLLLMAGVTSFFNCTLDRLIINKIVSYIIGIFGTMAIILIILKLSNWFVMSKFYLLLASVMVILIYILVLCFDYFIIKKDVKELNTKLKNAERK